MTSCYNVRTFAKAYWSFVRATEKTETRARDKAYKAKGTERKTRTVSGFSSVNVNRKG